MASRSRISGVPNRKENPIVAKGIFTVGWKDTVLLRTFLSDRGKIRARRVTRLTMCQQAPGGERDPQ